MKKIISNTKAFQELSIIYDKLAKDSYISTKTISPELIEYLEMRKIAGTWFYTWRPDILLKNISDHQFLSIEDAEFFNALLEAIYCIRYEIKFIKVLMWFCGIGSFVAIGYIIEHFLKF